MFILDFHLKSKIVILTFTLLGKIYSSVFSISVVSYMPGFKGQPILFERLFLSSNISIISSNVNRILYTMSSRSLFFAYFKSSSLSFSKAPGLDKKWSFTKTVLFFQLVQYAIRYRFGIQALIILLVRSSFFGRFSVPMTW